MATATLPELRPVVYVYDSASPMPPVATAEAIQVLARNRGPSAVQELESATGITAAVVRQAHAGLAAGEDLQQFRSVTRGIGSEISL